MEYLAKILCCFLGITFPLKTFFPLPFIAYPSSVGVWTATIYFLFCDYILFLTLFQARGEVLLLSTSKRLMFQEYKQSWLNFSVCLTSLRLTKGFSLVSWKKTEREDLENSDSSHAWLRLQRTAASKERAGGRWRELVGGGERWWAVKRDSGQWREPVGAGKSGDLLQDGHHHSSLDAPRTQEGCLLAT